MFVDATSSKRLREEITSLPAYTIPEAARYLGVPVATARSWIIGRTYPIKTGRRRFPPLIVPADPESHTLSFVNLVEIHVLSSLRKDESIRIKKIRKAIQYLRAEFQSEHPLIDKRLDTDGVDLFVQEYGQLINISEKGQLAMKEIMRLYLRRVERDPRGIPIRLYPFTRPSEKDSPRSIVIDPHVSFGRPVLAGTGVPTAVIADCYKAGDSISELAEEYGRTIEEIEEAIRLEISIRAA